MSSRRVSIFIFSDGGNIGMCVGVEPQVPGFFMNASVLFRLSIVTVTSWYSLPSTANHFILICFFLPSLTLLNHIS